MHMQRKAAQLLILSITALIFGAQVPCRAQKQISWIQAPDERLSQKYTIRAPKVQVGELFEYLARESGVDIRCTEMTADPEISVFVVKKSLGDLMDAVRSLFS